MKPYFIKHVGQGTIYELPGSVWWQGAETRIEAKHFEYNSGVLVSFTIDGASISRSNFHPIYLDICNLVEKLYKDKYSDEYFIVNLYGCIDKVIEKASPFFAKTDPYLFG